MDTLRGMLKSKTININALVTILLVAYLQKSGIELDPETAASIVALGYGLLNVFLRFLTDKSLPEKGIVLPNPRVVQQTVAAIDADSEALDRLIDAFKRRIAERQASAVQVVKGV